MRETHVGALGVPCAVSCKLPCYPSAHDRVCARGPGHWHARRNHWQFQKANADSYETVPAADAGQAIAHSSSAQRHAKPRIMTAATGA